jgi:hypothetical protein
MSALPNPVELERSNAELTADEWGETFVRRRRSARCAASFGGEPIAPRS